MNAYLLKLKKTINGKAGLEIFMLFALLVVWIVWPLRGTIAARNIALVSGAVSSIVWLIIERPKFALMDMLPIGFLLCIPAWLFGLYIYQPIVPHLQLDELRGTWMRVVIAIIFAIGLGKLYLSRPQIHQFFFLILFIWPIVVLLLFICQGLFTHSLFGEQIYIDVFKSKVAGVYFLIWSLIFCFSVFHSSIRDGVGLSNLPITIRILFLICLADYFFLKSLNSFVCIFFCIFYLTYCFVSTKNRDITKFNYFWKLCLSGFGILILVLIIYLMDTTLYANKLTNLVSDINFIVNFDGTGAWKCGGTGTRECFGSYNGPYPPINEVLGVAVNGSTYERLAWSREGLNFLKLNPFGLGYVVDAFSYYMGDKYVGSGATKTHSGWLDFALGAGYVGLILVWLAMGSIFLRARINMFCLKKTYTILFYVCWSVVVSMLLWSIAELSDREYVEHFFFMITFFAIAIGSPKTHFLHE